MVILEPVEVVERFEPMMLISLLLVVVAKLRFAGLLFAIIDEVIVGLLLLGSIVDKPVVIKIKFPALSILLAIFLVSSITEIPPFFLDPKRVSLRLRSCRVEMLISSPAEESNLVPFLY